MVLLSIERVGRELRVRGRLLWFWFDVVLEER